MTQPWSQSLRRRPVGMQEATRSALGQRLAGLVVRTDKGRLDRTTAQPGGPLHSRPDEYANPDRHASIAAAGIVEALASPTSRFSHPVHQTFWDNLNLISYPELGASQSTLNGGRRAWFYSPESWIAVDAGDANLPPTVTFFGSPLPLGELDRVAAAAGISELRTDSRIDSKRKLELIAHGYTLQRLDDGRSWCVRDLGLRLEDEGADYLERWIEGYRQQLDQQVWADRCLRQLDPLMEQAKAALPGVAIIVDDGKLDVLLTWRRDGGGMDRGEAVVEADSNFVGSTTRFERLEQLDRLLSIYPEPYRPRLHLHEDRIELRGPLLSGELRHDQSSLSLTGYVLHELVNSLEASAKALGLSELRLTPELPADQLHVGGAQFIDSSSAYHSELAEAHLSTLRLWLRSRGYDPAEDGALSRKTLGRSLIVPLFYLRLKLLVALRKAAEHRFIDPENLAFNGRDLRVVVAPRETGYTLHVYSGQSNYMGGTVPRAPLIGYFPFARDSDGGPEGIVKILPSASARQLLPHMRLDRSSDGALLQLLRPSFPTVIGDANQAVNQVHPGSIDWDTFQLPPPSDLTDEKRRLRAVNDWLRREAPTGRQER